MKLSYVTPEAEIIELSTEDILATSGPNGPDFDNPVEDDDYGWSTLYPM